ncbi:unnamed protein product, partial [Medioppia subpectinata]
SYSSGDVINGCGEQPFVHVLDIRQKSLKCDYCFNTSNKSSAQLKRCSKCLQMFYCGKQCQREDWYWHKYECPVYVTTGAADTALLANDYMARLLLRLWLLVDNRPELQRKTYRCFNGQSRCLAELESHTQDIDGDDYRALQFSQLCTFYDGLNVSYNRDRLFTLYGQLLINSFAITIHDIYYENVKTGYALYIGCSVFDHSCAPDACVQFDGPMAAVRAVRDIPAGQPVFIHYISLDDCRSDRRQRLRSQYYFDCNCSKCCAEELADNSIVYDRFKDLQRKLMICFSDESCGRLNDTFGQLDELLTIGDQIYGPTHPELAALLMIGLQYRLTCPDADHRRHRESLSAYIDRTGRAIGQSFGTDHHIECFPPFVMTFGTKMGDNKDIHEESGGGGGNGTNGDGQSPGHAFAQLFQSMHDLSDKLLALDY